MGYQIYIRLDPTSEILREFNSLEEFISSQVALVAELIEQGYSDVNLNGPSGEKVGYFVITEESDDVHVEFEIDEGIEKEIIKEDDKREVDDLLEGI